MKLKREIFEAALGEPYDDLPMAEILETVTNKMLSLKSEELHLKKRKAELTVLKKNLTNTLAKVIFPQLKIAVVETKVR